MEQVIQEEEVQTQSGGVKLPAEASTVKYAGFWIRWVAYFIDGLVLIVPNAIVGFILGTLSGGTPAPLLSGGTGFLVSWIYFVAMTNAYQATLGKKAVGIRVISDRPDGLTLGQIILRETGGRLLSLLTLCIGYLMAAFTKRKQSLHDKLAGTLVVYDDPNRKMSTWVIVLAVLACGGVAIAVVGIFSSIVLVSLNAARVKAQDAAVRPTLSVIMAEAILYLDAKGSYAGYKVPASVKTIPCSGDPIINVSPDGQRMAAFVRKCSDTKKYYCDDATASGTMGGAADGPPTQGNEVDEAYAKSGQFDCFTGSPAPTNAADITDIPVPTSAPTSVWPADADGLYLDVSSDVAMITSATETARQWQSDAEPYAAIMLGSTDMTEGHVVVFKSKNQPGKMFEVYIGVDGKGISSKEQPDQLGQNGYIGLGKLKVSSSQALSIGDGAALGKIKGALPEYRRTLILAYVKEQNANVWIYTLVNQKTPTDRLVILVDAATGQVIPVAL